MAEVAIVAPGQSYAVASDHGGLWILPEMWKTPGTAETASPHRLGVSHSSLDGLRPSTGSTGPAAAPLWTENG